jgi:hypothetical protein
MHLTPDSSLLLAMRALDSTATCALNATVASSCVVLILPTSANPVHRCSF